MLPGIAKMKNQLASANLDEKVLKRQVAIIDSMTAEGAAQPRHPQGQPQEAHRGRLRHQGRGGQQAPQDAPRHGRHDEDDGLRQARPDGGARQHDGAWRWGLWRRHAEPGGDGQARGEDAGGIAWDAGCRWDCPGFRKACRACRRNFRPVRAAARPRRRSFRAWAGFPVFPVLAKRNEPNSTPKGNEMSLKIRLSRAGTKKRPYYHIVIADSRSPRDGRFIERIGHYQSAAGQGQRSAAQARRREGQGLDRQGRAADRPRAALPRRRPA